MEPVKPINYNIVFEPDLQKFEFTGREKILVEIGKPTKKLVLNSADIRITGCNIKMGSKILKAKVKMNSVDQEVELVSPSLLKGKAEIFLEFDGTINGKLSGFYRSRYEGPDGKPKFLATTHFEPADARRMFPCWDDPGKKATFDISVVIAKNLDAISNMPVLEEKISGKKKMVVFDTTPVMSTYLVYLGVGEFESIQDNLRKIKIRVVTVPGKKNLGELALSYCKKFLDFYENYFGVKYPLPKLDLIALPDFHAAAMENWGAITFRETSLLYDKKNSSIGTMQHIAETVSHELVHQWFGNLVTMKWWNDLWLNESFATFMANKAVDKFYPKWDYWSQFLSTDTADAMSLDSLTTSHPIEMKVKTPSDAEQMFDEISYQKGGNILRMIENYLGEDAFQKGLQYYISKHLYGNATTKDLWRAFEKVSNKPIVEMMTGKHGWISHVGYPLIEVELDNSKIKLSQKRFLLDQSAGQNKSSWMIPLSIETNSGNKMELMSSSEMKIELGNDRWIKLNSGHYGFYRVQYPRQLIDSFKNLVREKKLINVDRWGIESDLFATVVAGKKSIKEYFEFIKSYSNEEDYLVLSDIESTLHSIDLLSSQETFWPEIKEQNKIFYRKILDKLGWEPKKGEKHTDPFLRSSTLLFLGRNDDEDVLRTAKEKFDLFLKDRNSLHPNLRNVVFGLVAWQGDEKTYDLLLKLYRNEKNPEEKRRLLISLGSFKDQNLLLRTLDYSLSSEVRSQDTFFPVIVVAGNPYGRNIIWPWVKRNWKHLRKTFVMSSVALLGRIVETLSVIADARKESEMREFFERNPAKGTEMTINQTLERLRINSNFLERMRSVYGKR